MPDTDAGSASGVVTDALFAGLSQIDRDLIYRGLQVLLNRKAAPVSITNGGELVRIAVMRRSLRLNGVSDKEL